MYACMYISIIRRMYVKYIHTQYIRTSTYACAVQVPKTAAHLIGRATVHMTAVVASIDQAARRVLNLFYSLSTISFTRLHRSEPAALDRLLNLPQYSSVECTSPRTPRAI